jgi:hypothetical protein
MSKTTGILQEAGTAYPSQARVAHHFCFCVVFYALFAFVMFVVPIVACVSGLFIIVYLLGLPYCKF